MFSFWYIVTHIWVVDPPTILKSTKILVQIYEEHFYLLEIKKKTYYANCLENYVDRNHQRYIKFIKLKKKNYRFGQNKPQH